MKLVSTLLGSLGKALKGNASQEAGDSLVNIPNIFINTVQIPEPNNFFFNNFTHAATDFKSFGHSDDRLFNNNNSVVMYVLGPGLWNVNYTLQIVPEGIVDDITSTIRYQLGLVDGITNPVMNLARFVNSKAFTQSIDNELTILIPSDQTVQMIVTSVIGLGTGTNRAQSSFNVNRYL